MKFGLFYEHQIPRPWTQDSEYQQFQNALNQVEMADGLGYDYAWMVEHHFLEEYSHGSSPTAFLSAASQRTSQIRLGHGIWQLPTNHPIHIAEHTSTLDLLSSGRAELGTGEGGGPAELHPFGARVRRKREMWEEGIVALHGCLTKDDFAFEGEFWNFPRRNVLPKPFQKPHPPLWVACSNINTIEMAARRGIGALGFQFATPEGARAWVNRYYSLISSDELEPLTDYQLNPNLAMVSGFMCAPTDKQAREMADGWTFFVFCLARNSTHKYEPGSADLWEEYQEWRLTDKHEAAMESGLIGSPATIRAKLRDFADTHIDQVILLNQAGKNSHADICSSLQLFAKEVMPEFHALQEDQEAWKKSVLAGDIELENLSTEGVVTAVMAANPDIVRTNAAKLKAQGDVKEPIAT